MIAEAFVRVRYGETDRMGVAYYANYFVWFEVARTALFASIGLPYRVLEESYDCVLPVVEASCRYRRYVRYDDELEIECWLSRVARRGVTFGYRILKDGGLVAEGFTKHVVVDKRGKTKSFPQSVYNILKKVEYGGHKT